jgi:hypothetical protein
VAPQSLAAGKFVRAPVVFRYDLLKTYNFSGFEGHVCLPKFGRFCQLIQKLKWTMEHNSMGHAVAQLVEALLYKPEGRGFDP